MSYFDAALLKANTENGKDWLAKYLHPPSSKGTSYNGYPDKSVVPAIHPEYRLMQEDIQFTADLQNVMINLNTPGLKHPIYAAKKGKADNYSVGNDWYVMLSNDQISDDDVLNNFGRVRMSYLSTTVEMDATAFNNSGMIYACQFSPPIYQLTLPQTLAALHKQGQDDLALSILLRLHPGASKHHYNRMVRPNSDSTYVVVDNAPDKIWANIMADGDINISQVARLGHGIAQPTDITMMSPKSYVSRAVEGCFTVHQINQDFNSWTPIRPSVINPVSTTTASRGLMFCFYEIEYNEPTAGASTRINPFKTDGAALPNTDTPWGDWTWSYTYFANITTSGAPSNVQFAFKVIQGFEMSPIPRSIMASQVLPPALYDPTALDTATVIVQSRQDAMAAKYNTEGDLIGGLLSGAAGMAANMIAPGTGALASAGVSTLVNAISGADGTKAEKKQMTEEVASAKPSSEKPQAETLATAQQEEASKIRRVRLPGVEKESNQLRREISALKKAMASMTMQGRSRSNSRRGRSRSGSRRRTPSMSRAMRKPKKAKAIKTMIFRRSRK